MAKPDWEAIESTYRAGVMSLREIASQHSISEGKMKNHTNYWASETDNIIGKDDSKDLDLQTPPNGIISPSESESKPVGRWS